MSEFHFWDALCPPWEQLSTCKARLRSRFIICLICTSLQTPILGGMLYMFARDPCGQTDSTAMDSSSQREPTVKGPMFNQGPEP